ncbi:MAG TPA: tetratricopeptide repeat protein [Rhodocyclaceae bacterium]|nr:tetratricopeptide repeat protein [Rhodocyclaceae bacterium]HUY02644.1 tetratricopeptide repeat protein [Rhodocyclaceae bacterium]
MNRSNLLTLFPVAIFTILGLCSSNSYAEEVYNERICGPMINNAGTYINGPYDYRRTTQANKDLVENTHFNYPEKIMGNSKERNRVNVWFQFVYTLKIFPNSPRALAAIDRLSQLVGSDKPPGAGFSAECAFLRAVQFTPDDPVVRVLFGLYLGKRGRSAEAAAQLQEASRLAPDNVNVQYNLGLAYFQIKDYPHAREHAAVAYDMGYPLPGLREMLERAGYWEVKSGPGQNSPPVSAVSPQGSAPRIEPDSQSEPDAAPNAIER